MAWQYFNPNPKGASVGDCAIRAVSKATGETWEQAYSHLVVQGYSMGDLPNANHVWGAYLRRKGFIREIINNECPDCYTVAEFAEEHPEGTYVLATGNHAVCVQQGNYFDSWDSGAEVPAFYWFRPSDYIEEE